MTTRESFLAAAQKPGGVSAMEMSMPRSTAAGNFKKLEAAGLIFRAGGHLQVRYFGTQEEANAFRDSSLVSRAPPKRARVPMGEKKPRTRAGWSVDDPMHITSETVVTIAPTPPAPTHTNTHQVW